MTAPGARTRLRVGQLFALSMSALVVVGVLGIVGALLSLDSLGDARRRIVDRVDPALVSSEAFLTAMVDQETGLRGYQQTGDELFLEPYERGRATAPRELARVAGAVDAGAVQAAAQRWTNEFAAPTLAAVRGGDTDFTAAEIDSGKQRFDAIRSAVADVQASLRADRGAAREDLSAAAGRVRGILWAFALVGAVSLVAAALILRRSVVRPVVRLAEHVRDDAPITPDGAREVVELGDTLEAMRARINAEVAALEVARDELARSNTELEQFAYVASHDLQEPLRKVASFTQMLKSRYGGQLDERADTYIDFAVDGAKRMQELINDLLAFSRVGRLTEAQEIVDLNGVAERALESLAIPLREARGHVEVDPLPTVRGENRLLELVIVNLLSNAIKFRGEEPPLVELRVRRRDDDWCFTVSDNGIGIEPEYSERIFVIFQRLHPRSAYEGTGIGLAMCRKIVEYHGGAMWLDSETDGASGATFHFTLPVLEETAHDQ